MEKWHFAPGRDGASSLGWFQMKTEAGAKSAVIFINNKMKMLQQPLIQRAEPSRQVIQIGFSVEVHPIVFSLKHISIYTKTCLALPLRSS